MTTLPVFKPRRPNANEVKELLLWFGFYATFSAMPFYGSWLILAVFTEETQRIFDYTGKGELALLATSLLGSLFFTFLRDSSAKASGLPHGKWLTLAGVLIAIVCAIMFMGALLSARAADFAIANQSMLFLKASPARVTLVTSVAYLGTLILIVLTMMIDQQVRSTTPRELEEDSRRSLAADFQKLGNDK